MKSSKFDHRVFLKFNRSNLPNVFLNYYEMAVRVNYRKYKVSSAEGTGKNPEKN